MSHRNKLPARLLIIAVACTLLTTADNTAAGQPERAPSASNLLVLKDGSWIKGQLLSIDNQQGISWSHVDSGAEFSFPGTSVNTIHLSTSPPHPAGNDTVQLVNGMKINGTIEEYDDSKMLMTTSYATPISIPVESIAGFRFEHRNPADQKIVFDTMTPLSAWAYRSTSTPQFWSQPTPHTLAYNGRGTEFITRNANIPEVASISFDLTWKDKLNTNIYIGHEETPSPGEWLNFYRLDLTNDRINFHRELRTVRGSRPHNIGDANISEHLKGRHSAHFTISIDRINQRVAILINDQLVASWREQEKANNLPKGGGIQFRGNPHHPIIIRNLTVREWDGHASRTNLTPNESTANHDHVVVIGEANPFRKIESITRDENGERHVEIPVAVLRDQLIRIPASRVDHVLLNQRNQIDSAAFNTQFQPEATLLLADGSQLPATNLTLNDGKFHFSIFNNPETTSINSSHVLEITFPSPE